MIVTVEKLNIHMSAPKWSDAQTDAAHDILEGLEASLESKLHGAYITPRGPFTEQASLLESGLLATRQPVNTITALDGVTVTDNQVPTPWSFYDGYLHRPPATVGMGFGALGLADLAQFSDRSGRRDWGSHTITYMAGWGDNPALRMAIIKKARAILDNAHDDSVKMTNTDGEKMMILEEDWTEAEIAALGTFRNLIGNG